MAASHAKLASLQEIRLAELLGALSHALDMVEGQPAGHCVRCCWIGIHIGQEIGLSEKQIWELYYVLLLKDLGCSSNAARICRLFLTDDLTFKQMHAAYTQTILSRIAAFGDLAPIAGAHHERLDGKGYPRGLKGDEIVRETRIITTADIFDALTADRPYRAAMPVTKALAIMTDMVGTAIDTDCFEALRRALGRADETLAAW